MMRGGVLTNVLGSREVFKACLALLFRKALSSDSLDSTSILKPLRSELVGAAGLGARP